MSQVTIFLACSEELKADRDNFQRFIARENDKLHKKGIYLALKRWEEAFNPMMPQGTQSAYNEVVKQCDIIVCLFYTKVGPFTLQEFDTALEHFSKTGKPLIYTYFKKLGPKEIETPGLKAFKKRLFNDLKHFYAKYEHFADLQNQFRHQLDLMEEKGIIRLQQEKKEEYIKKYKIRFYTKVVTYFLIAIVAFTGAGLWYNYDQQKQPFNLKVSIENKTPNSELPEPVGKLSLTYGTKTETKDNVRSEALFESIPGIYRKDTLRLRFFAVGFTTIDTLIVPVKYAVQLPVRRNNDLAILTGFITSNGNNPLASVKVSTDCCTTYTDSSGQFKLEIPFQHQRVQQRLFFYKKGYTPKDITTPVIPGEPVRLAMY